MTTMLQIVEKHTPEAFQVPYWDVESLWPKVSPMLQKAIAVQDEWTLEAVYKKLTIDPRYDVMGMQLWYCPNKFALVTQIQVMTTGIRKCLLFLCGGQDLEAIKASEHVISKWAKTYHGCSKLMISGREGWAQLDGFKRVSTVLEKDI